MGLRLAALRAAGAPLLAYFSYSAILAGLFERKCVLYMPCLFLIDLSIPSVIHGLLNCLCLLWDICFHGACLSTIS